MYTSPMNRNKTKSNELRNTGVYYVPVKLLNRVQVIHTNAKFVKTRFF